MNADRAKTFKKTIDLEDGRRKREDSAINIRKQKREENLQKKRNMSTVNDSAESNDIEINDSNKPVLEKLNTYVSEINSSDPAAQFRGVQAVRKLLSVDKAPPAKEIIEAGVLIKLVSFIEAIDNPNLQFEAAWALTNIASTTFTSFVVDCGAVPIMVKLLRSVNADVREQCIWCLGNIAGEGTKYRDMILNIEDSVEALLANVTQPASISLLRNATWTLSNFCRGKPVANFERLRVAVGVLGQLITSQTDAEVLADAAWALSYLSDGSDSRIQGVIDGGVCAGIVALLGHPSANVITPALRTTGNIVSGNEGQTQHMLELPQNMLGALTKLMDHDKKAIRKETCWALSNVAAGTPAQISSVLSVHGLPEKLINIIRSDLFEVKREAAWAVSNSLSGGNFEHIKRMVNAGAIAALVSLLPLDDTKLVVVAVDAIESILKTSSENGGEGAGSFFQTVTLMLDEAEGIDAIEKLQYHENNDIYIKGVRILETYLGAEDDVDENVAPSSNNLQFDFGAPLVTPTKQFFGTLTKFESPAFN